MIRNVLLRKNFNNDQYSEKLIEDIFRLKLKIKKYKIQLEFFKEDKIDFIDKTLIDITISKFLSYRSTIGTEQIENIHNIKLTPISMDKIINKNSEESIAENIKEIYNDYTIGNRLDPNDIKNIHKLIFKNNGNEKNKPGKYKKINNQITETKVFLDQKLVADYMNYLCQEINISLNTNELEKQILFISWIHGQLLGIHPFGDGNGRVARFITDKILSKKIETNLFLNESIFININDYREKLNCFHLEGELLPLTYFFINTIIQQININIKALEMLDKKWMIIKNKLSKIKIKKKYIESLTAILVLGSTNNKEISKQLNITRETATSIIKILIEKKILIKGNIKGRYAEYKVIF